MPNKDRENRQLTLLRALIPEFPSGAIEPSESPDFIVRNGSAATGIEFTEFHLPPSGSDRPHQEIQALKERIVATAHRIHSEAGGPPLYVSVFFRGSSSLTKSAVRPLAEAVYRAVRQAVVPPFPEDSRVAYDVLPPEVIDISVRASFNGHDELWSAD